MKAMSLNTILTACSLIALLGGGFAASVEWVDSVNWFKHRATADHELLIRVAQRVGLNTATQPSSQE